MGYQNYSRKEITTLVEKVNIDQECMIEIDDALIIKELCERLKEGIIDGLEDDKKPNPIYIPKHVQHRRKGRK